MKDGDMMRIRLEYEKGKEIKFLSHLDMARVWERMIRRSGLRPVLTQGFNPHIKLSLGTVLPVGMWSKSEYLDMEIDEEVSPEFVIERLNQYTPPGIRVKRAQEIAASTPALMAVINAAVYRFAVTGSEEILRPVIQTLLDQTDILITQRGGEKTADIRPGILRVDMRRTESGLEIESLLAAGNQSPVRIQDFMEALLRSGLDTDQIADYWRETCYIKEGDSLNDPMPES